MRTLVYSGLFSVLFLTSATYVHAQILTSLESVQIQLSPAYPQPGQTVTATLTSSTADLRASKIVWLLNEEVIPETSDNFSFTVGTLGTSSVVGAVVETSTGQVLTDTVTVKPTEVTLLWEASTYTPTLYKGRALYSSGSVIRAEALAHFVNDNGEDIDSSELVYTWRKNGNIIDAQSGLGAHVLTLEGPKFFGSYILSVEVQTRNSAARATSAAEINTHDPVIQLYQEDPLLGIQYHDAVLTHAAFDTLSQITLHAVPYFMDIQNPDTRDVLYDWRINGTRADSVSERPSQVTLQLSTDDTFETQLAVSVEHVAHLLQSVAKTFSFSFEQTAQNSLFGL